MPGGGLNPKNDFTCRECMLVHLRNQHHLDTALGVVCGLCRLMVRR